MAICPREGVGITHVGMHLLIDLYDAINLSDIEYIQTALETAARATGATILGANFHHFGEGMGVSGVVLLAESHISAHGWTEWSLLTIDVFVCGNCDPMLAVPVLEEYFQPTRKKNDFASSW